MNMNFCSRALLIYQALPEHLLIGIILEKVGGGGSVLREPEADIDTVRAELGRLDS